MGLVTGDLSRMSFHSRREQVGNPANWGVLDDAAGPQKLYLNTEGLQGSKETRRSAIARASGVPGPSRMVGRTGGGAFTADFAFGAQLYAFFEELLLEEWSAPYSISSASIEADGPSNELRGTGNVFAAVERGTWIVVGGFTSPAEGNNAEAYVSDKADDNTLTLAYVTLTTKAAGDTVTVDGRHLRNGTTPISRGYERHHEDLDEYDYYPGQIVDSGEVPLGLQEIITPTFNLAGWANRPRSGSSAWTNPPLAAELYTKQVADKQNNVSGFRAGGALYGAWRSFSFSWANSITVNPPGEGLDPVSASTGGRTLTGNMEAYLQAADGRAAKALNHTPEDFHFRVANDAGDHILYATIFAAKATTTGDTPKSANTGPSLLNTPWEADAADWDPDLFINLSRLGL